MKKTVLIIPLIIIVLIFYLVAGVTEIQTNSVKIRVNNLEGSETFVIEDTDLIQVINSIITSKIYYNQRFISSYSQNDIDFELDMFEFDENRVMTKWYRILLNVDESTRISSRSRIDIMDLRSGYTDFSKSKSFLLTLEQSEKLVQSIEEFIY
ncbi:MAG TPA: hypothetical protein DCS67_11690 [Clostridiales bacterium UBA8960]|jgi:hypothetical protein|nr:hypothetical protein [Clostridiales bacterium UBA8960]